MKISAKARIRKKADRLYYEKYTKECCEICLRCDVDPAHHFFFKGQYDHLRYEPDNAVTLCIHCHHELHHGGLRKEIENKIIMVKGYDWHNRLLIKANKFMGSGWKNVGWFKEQYNILKNG